MRLSIRPLVCVIALLGAATAGAQSVSVGLPAPEIDLPVLNGGRMTLSGQRGHPVVVSFWGTWCPPCRDEFPHLVRVHREHASAGLQVLAVNGLDQESSTKAITKFVQRYSATFPVLLDERGRMRALYRITGLPMTVFIDTAGVLRRVHTGPISATELDAGLSLIVPKR